MKIFTHNFNPHSNSGPNKFSRQLFRSLIKNNGVSLTNNCDDADVEFCLIQQQAHKVKPMLLRLDGIYFNSEQDYNNQNAPIRFAYENADAVVFQSNFNKKLTEYWFGKHRNSHVIHNAPDTNMIKSANPSFFNEKFGPNTEVWSCAASWRPHKRLKDNIRYFLENASKDAIFAIAGALHMDAAKEITSINKRIVLMGDLDYMSLLSLYRRSSNFIHLAYLDHCPNVVVDAQAAGCHVICSSTGGTNEIVYNGTIIQELEWDYSPTQLYNPPEMDFENYVVKLVKNKNENNIVHCSQKYYNLFARVMNDRH